MRPKCICGCGQRAQRLPHHVIYQQHVRLIPGASLKDPRNLVPVAPSCHEQHHNRSHPFKLAMLPDSAFEFAAETLGSRRAFSYMRRRYADEDPRLDALVMT